MFSSLKLIYDVRTRILTGYKQYHLFMYLFLWTVGPTMSRTKLIVVSKAIRIIAVLSSVVFLSDL